MKVLTNVKEVQFLLIVFNHLELKKAIESSESGHGVA
jgi:hypothetical protein